MPSFKNDKAFEYISSNIAANMLGLGSVATPAGLKAMKELEKENKVLPYLLKYYKENYELSNEDLLKYYNEEHNVPEEFERILKERLK